jgi:outer membrane protein assembly factor BamB
MGRRPAAKRSPAAERSPAAKRGPAAERSPAAKRGPAAERGPATKRGPASVDAHLAPMLACLVFACLVLTSSLTATAHAEPEWTTYHRDPARSGDDPEATQPVEPKLAWQTEDLGAPIWGQPLVLGSRVYVATVGDDVYALEAATGKVIWQQSAGTPVPAGALTCGDISPTVGIVSTPLIDTATGKIYVVADTWNALTKEATHLLEGFDLETGEPVPGTPVDPPGIDAKTLLQRSALNIDEGEIVFGFGGNYGSCSQELAPIVAVPATGGPARFWQTHGASSPTTAGGMWATSGAAVDSAGDIYAATANPLPPEGEPITSYDYSDSVVKLSLADFVAAPKEAPLAELGWFEPPNWEFLSNHDLDLGSAGAELLPGGLLFQAGKDGNGYLIDEATMSSGAPAVYSGEVCNGHGSFGGDAYAAGTLYIPCTNGVQALAYEAATRSFRPLWQGPANAVGSPIVSGGLVWVVATGGFTGGGETLYGLDPATGATRYAETLPSPVIDHFASPSAAGGRLFVATGSSVTAYQLAAPSSAGTGSDNANPATGTSAPAAGTASAPGGASTPHESPDTAAGPTVRLLRNRLRVTANGNVRVALRCSVTTGKCKGTVTLIAEIAVTVHRGKRSVRRVIPFTLARARFGPVAGDFIVTVHLDRSAEARLRRHGDRLALRVVLAAPPSETVSVGAVLR